MTLDAIADGNGKFAVLAMDQRGTLRRMLTEAGRTATAADMAVFKIDVVRALSPHASGVLLDLELGVEPARAAGVLADGVGVLLAAEPAEKQKVDGEYLTVLEPGQDAAWVAANRGDALKFLVQWDPDRVAQANGPDLSQIALDVIRGIADDCRAGGVPSVIEPLVAFAPGREPSREDKEAAVVRSAIRMATCGMDLLKIEWPGGAAGCDEVTAGLGRVPWALLSAGVDYAAFVDRTRTALDHGATGFIAGRAIWGEAVTMDGEARRSWLAEVAVPRMQGLAALLAEHGRGWKEVAG